MENLKKKLEKRKVNYKLLWDKFIEQGLLLKNTKNKESRLAKNGTKIIIQACKTVFFVGFEKYRTIVRVHFPLNPIEPLQTDYLDKSLLTVVVDSTERFVRASRFPVEVSNIDAAIQIDGNVCAEEDCFVDSCPCNAPK